MRNYQEGETNLNEIESFIMRGEEEEAYFVFLVKFH